MTEKDQSSVEELPGAAGKRSKRGARPPTGSSKSFTVEKVRTRSAARVQSPAVPDPTPVQTKISDASLLSEAEKAFRLNALVEARMREPEERLAAQEKARAEAERDTAMRFARLEKELSGVKAERDAERRRVTAVTTNLEETEQSRNELEKEIAKLRAQLTSAHEQLRQNAAALDRERENSSNLKATLSTRTVEAWGNTAKRDELAKRLEQAESELAEYRSRPWWRLWPIPRK